MIGLGLGGGIGGGGAEQALTVVGLLGGDAMVSGLERIAGAFNQVDEAQDRVSKTGATMQRVGMGLTAGVSGSMIAMGMTAIKSAMDVEESESLVATTFGANTEKIKTWSEERRKAFGVNSYDQRRQAASFQSQFTAGGLDENKAMALSKAFTEMKDDYVSFKNIADPEVFAALQSGISGEQEPLRRLSIFMSEASVKAYAYKNGIAAANMELTEQQKLQARAGFILDAFNKSKAKGDLDRTKDSTTNRMRAAQNEFKMAVTDFGKAALPVMTDVLKLAKEVLPVFTDLVNKFKELPESTRKWMIYSAIGLGPGLWGGGKVTSMLAALKGGKGLPQLPGGEAPDASSSSGWKGKLDELKKGTTTLNCNIANVSAKVSYMKGGLLNVGGGGAAAGAAGAAAGAGAGSAGAAGAAAAVPLWRRILFGSGLERGGHMGPHQAGRAGWMSRNLTGGGMGAASKSATPWIAGIAIGVGGYTALNNNRREREEREISQANAADNRAVTTGQMSRDDATKRAAEREQNRAAPDSTGNALSNTWGRLTSKWDFKRGQSNYDSQMQMKSASEKYQGDLQRVRKEADAYAEKNKLSKADADIDYYKRLIAIENHWAHQYDVNGSHSGLMEHYNRAVQGEKKLKAARDKKQKDWEQIAIDRNRNLDPDAGNISNNTLDNRRKLYNRWAKANFGDKTVTGMMKNWEEENAPKKQAAPRQDWDARTAGIAANFGLGSANNALSASSRENRDDTTTITLRARPSDAEHRNLRVLNRTPQVAMP